MLTAREIVIAALEIDPAQRAEYLTQACGADPDLLEEVQALLKTRGKGTAQDSTVTIHSNFQEAIADGSIGPYNLVRQLGEGGMGVVYHAQQLQPIRRDVALKIIKPGMDSKQVIARFESERQALAMMDHANIAHMFDAGTSNGRPYFVMELVEGVPITRYCDSKRLTLKKRIELFIPVCQAIQHAHQKGIIHRDIKPSNVLVKQQGNHAICKVIDFGLAKALGNQLSDATMVTNLGTVVGTLDYMSPEQAELGKQDIDTRSDVYSLGALLYELLTGTLPLDYEHTPRGTYVEVLQRIREEQPKRPSTRLRRSTELKNTAALRQSDPARLPKLLDHDLDWIVMKALEKDRSRRYETVNGIARDLKRYLEGEPVEAAPPSTVYRMRKFVRKYRIWLATAAAFVAVLVAGVVVSTWLAARASRAEQVARAVNAFLEDDLLAQASARKQAHPDTKPDPNLTVRTALDRAAGRIAGRFDAQPLVEASIRETIGSTYTDLGLYPEAVRQLERALDLRRRVLGEQHGDTLDSMDRLGAAYREHGKYAQAERLLVKLLDIQRHVLGEEHPQTLRGMNGLAVLYVYEGKYAQADELYRKTLDVQRRVLGEEHPDTLIGMGNLGGLYVREGKYAQAEAVLAKLLETKRRVLGEEHPDTLTMMNNVAGVYYKQRKYPQAEALFSNVVDVRSRVLGEEHPQTLTSLYNLASVYGLQGKYAQAAALYRKTLDVQRRVLGEEHPSTLTSMAGLAWAYGQQGNYLQAEALFSKVVGIQRRVLGEEHPSTLFSMDEQAEMYGKQGKYRQSETLYTKVLEARRRALGAQHPDTADVIASLGRVLLQEHKYAEAEPLLLSRYQGMLQQAIIPNESRARLQKAGEQIVQLYDAWGKPEKVAEWKQKLEKVQPSVREERP